MIDPNNKVPLYHQLYQALRQKITTGEWQPGSLIPPESQLIREYNLSRGTVRQALDQLVTDGLVNRQRGRGTFVSVPTIQLATGEMVTFIEDMRQRDLSPSTRLLSAELVDASTELASKLSIQPGEEIARIERLRLADGVPISIERAHLVHAMCPGVLDNDYASQSLRLVLAHHYNLYQVRGEQVVRAIVASQELSRILDINEKAAILYIERLSYSSTGQPIEYLQLYHRGDRYCLYNELVGWLPEQT